MPVFKLPGIDSGEPGPKPLRSYSSIEARWNPEYLLIYEDAMGRRANDTTSDDEIWRLIGLRSDGVSRCGSYKAVDEAWGHAKACGYTYEDFVAPAYACSHCPLYLTCVLEGRPVNPEEDT